MSIILAVVVWLGAGVAFPQAQTLEALEQLFETNPAAALEEANTAFEALLTEEDLPRAMDIFRMVASWSAQCHHYAAADQMAARAAPLAEAKGDWGALGELLAQRALCVLHGGVSYMWAAGQRFVRLTDAANAARERVGNPTSIAWEERYRNHRARADEDPAARWSEELQPMIRDLKQAVADLRDDDVAQTAEEIMEVITRRLEEDPDHRTVLDCRRSITILGGYLVTTPGAERLIPPFRALVDRYDALDAAYGCLAPAMRACVYRWTGRDDIFRDTFYWCLGHFRPLRHEIPGGQIARFAAKLVAFRRPQEAERLVRRLLEMANVAPPYGMWASGDRLTWPGMPEGLRREVLLLAQRTTSELLSNPPDRFRYSPREIMDRFARSMERVVRAEPPDVRQGRALEVATLVRELAVTSPAPDVGSSGLLTAAELFDQAARPDLAEECREIAKALRAGDPTALLQMALNAAQGAAREGKWEEVVTALKGPAKSAAPEANLISAALLLHHAHRRLEQATEAEAWLKRASELVGQAKLTHAERANYLARIAARVADRREKVAFLRRAQSAAKEAELEMLQERLDDQLATAALDAGDLGAARRALLDIVNRSEEKRQRLAFDPQLRKQWFADNIGPYRRLLRAAALQGDVHLALQTAERMRSRALVDQLAWQKVDMGVELTREEQERLSELRAMRREVYGLLQWVMGGSAPDEAEGDAGRGHYIPIRGHYIPIRGHYIPIRGPLDGDRAATAQDIERLQGLLDDLAAEETALESAIRESVPAYEYASRTRIPTGEELVRAVEARADVGVLHYTFCDEGLVVVAIRAGIEPRVVLIREDPDKLWERIGKFRELIWEREADALEAGAELYQTLVAPVQDALAGVTRIWVIGDGALQLVPFSALVCGDGVYLGWYCAVATAPSLSLALTARGDRPAPAKPALVVAAPDTGSIESDDDDTRGHYMPIRGMYMPIRGHYMPVRGEGGISAALTMMAMISLPGARAEGEEIAGRFPGSELLSGKAATKAALLRSGGDCDILHIATHGFADPDFPEFSGLLLAGDEEAPYEVLTAGEVYAWPLKARLVTLSACQTALGKDVEGEGLLGLTRAFIYAGARDVVCSLWPVSDESTKMLMSAFYAKLQEGAPVEEALQEAQKALMQQEATNHPFFWAGFVPVRGPG